MADGTPPPADLWKVVPCHFIWKLEESTDVVFKRIANNLDSKLETRNEEEWRESACDMLLFRGYIEVSNFVGVQRNPQKAEEFFLEAEREAMRVTDDDERQAYITVVTANRLWLLESFQETSPDEGNRSKLLTDLENSWMRSRDECSQKRFDAFIDAIAAFALARLGPNKYKEAERRYQRALTTIKTKSWWYQSLGAVIGRQGRRKIDNFDDLYDGIDDEIKCYEKAIELDPQNSSARCDLALALLRFPERKGEARNLISGTGEMSGEIIGKKASFYRRVGDTEEALKVLRVGESLEHPKANIFLMLSCVYHDLAFQAKNERNSGRHTECNNKEMEYLNKCIQLDPFNFSAKMKKGIALCTSERYTEGLAILQTIIQDSVHVPEDVINAQRALANALFIQNRCKCNEEVARTYETLVDTGIEVIRSSDPVCKQKIFKYIKNAKERLECYYNSVDGDGRRLQILRNKLSEIGFDG